MQQPTPPPSLNDRAAHVLDAAIADALALRIGVTRAADGHTLVDCGHSHLGGTEAGLRLARICLAGLAEVSLVPAAQLPLPWAVLVRTSHPVLACLGSQYAGWHLATADGTALMGSGPARALARQEPLFQDLPHEERAFRAVLVLEGDTPPDRHVAREVAQTCDLPQTAVTLFHAPTGSLAGTVQIAARVLECAIQKARHLGFPLADLHEGIGTAPVAPPHPDTRLAMGRANDAIIYGGRVQLFVSGSRDAARDLARTLPSRTVPEWGQSFAEVFDAANGDFAHIDPGLFAPAEVAVTALSTGETFRSGRTDAQRLYDFLEAD